MQKFRSQNRTVVTELKSFIVDEVSRTGAFRQGVSARVPSDTSITTTDFNVSKTEHHTVDRVHAVVGILSPANVIIRLEQTGLNNAPEPEPDPSPNTTAKIIVSSSVVVSNPLTVSVEDKDVPLSISKVRVVLYNETSGETEYLDLTRSSTTIFSGIVSTAFGDVGINFDGTMYARHGDIIRVIYEDGLDEFQHPQTITANVVAESPFVDSTLSVNSFIHVGRNVAVTVEDRDLSGLGHVEATVSTSRLETDTMLLLETSPGFFSGVLPTRINTGSPIDNDSVLDIEVGDTISVEFIDTTPNTVATHTATIEVHATANSNGVLTTPLTIENNGILPVLLFDYDLANAPYIDVAISNNRSGEVEYAHCVSTLQGSGTFKGQIQLTSAASNSGDGTMSVQIGDELRAVYVDSTTESGGSAVIDAITTVVGPAAPIDPTPGEPEPEPEPEPDPEDPEDEGESSSSTVEFISTGLFYLNGAFNGKITIIGLSSSKTRCSLIHV